MKKLIFIICSFSLLLIPTAVVFAEAGQTPATYGGATDTNSPAYCAQNGQTYSSAANGGSGGCVAIPTVPTTPAGSLPPYVPLEPIPGLNQTGQANFGQLLSQLFKILIILGALIAVAAFVFAGISYMVSEAIDTKSLAKKRLTGAFLGLMLLIGSWVILYTINPQLVFFSGGLNPTPYVAPPTEPNPMSTTLQTAVNNCLSNGTPQVITAVGGGYLNCSNAGSKIPVGGKCTDLSGEPTDPGAVCMQTKAQVDQAINNCLNAFGVNCGN